MFWTVAAILLGILYGCYQWYRNKNLPPGPWGVPIFGYLPWLNPAQPYKTLTQLARKYGPVYSIQMGKHFAVVLSDPTSVRAALARNELADRTNFDVINDIMQEHGIIKCMTNKNPMFIILLYLGLIFTRGELWKEQRKFVCNWLKVIGVTKFGDKKNNLQLNIVNAVNSTISVRNYRIIILEKERRVLYICIHFLNLCIESTTVGQKPNRYGKIAISTHW